MERGRFIFIFVIVSIGAAAIVSRLFFLQVISGNLYQAQALGQQSGFKEVEGSRGEVFFQNSQSSHGAFASGPAKSIAINKEKWLAYAIPKRITDKDAFARAVATNIGDTSANVLLGMAESDSYAVIKKDISQEEMEALKALKLDGLFFESSPSRYYPESRVAAQVVGFMGGDGTGQYGIEGHYDAILRGKTGIKEDRRGLDLITFGNREEDLNGSDLYLTIDYNIQFQAEALLQEAKKNIDIESGQIIVIRPDTGRVLALANYPFFDPNKYSKERNYDVFQNAAVQKIYEPGSVFKPFIMAMALNEGKISPDTTFTDTGSVTIGPDTIYNFDRKKYGLQTMSGILEKSINTGAVFLSKLLSQTTFLDYLEKLGFNAKTGIDVQGEVYSRNDVLKKGSPFGFATSSFGQGIEMTPIQLVQAFSVFANGGKVVKPYVVEKIVKGLDESATRPVISGQVVSPKTAGEVSKMLMNVVEKGFGDVAKIPGYYLAGKTGTAEVPIENGKGYYADKTIQSFIGYGPALKPEFLILVKLDNPKVPKSSLSAAPIFRKLAQYIINYWQIPPDYPVGE